MDGGRFFEMIKSELEQSVESIKVNKINSVDYAIPQRRERVIINAGKTDMVNQFSLTPVTGVYKEGQIGLLPPIIGVEEALSDLPKLEQAEDGSSYNYRTNAMNAFQKFIRGEMSPDDYIDSYKTEY